MLNAGKQQGFVVWILTNLARSVRAGRLSPGEVPQRCQAEISEDRNPALVMPHSCSPSLDGFCFYQLGLISETGSIADSDIRDVNLVSAAETAPA